MGGGGTKLGQLGRWKNQSGWWFQPIWKNMSQNGNLPQVGVKIKNIGNHHLAIPTIWNSEHIGHLKAALFIQTNDTPPFLRDGFVVILGTTINL